MDYHVLLDAVTELGYRLAMCGAETYRVEESINRTLAAYGIVSEVYAIPNCLTVSLATEDGQSITRMKRIGYHGSDLDAVERYSNLSRRICAEHPDPKTVIEWIKQTDAQRTHYKLPVYFISCFLGAFGFSYLFSAGFTDSLCAGACGLVIGIVGNFMQKLKVNPFFTTISSAFFMAIAAYLMSWLSICKNVDAVIIGALMSLVPGLLFTNAMRDIIYGDTNSGINRIVQVFLIAAALALGTGAAWGLASVLWGTPASIPTAALPLWIQCIGAFVGCIGFAIQFNIHGPGGLLCALGGILAWLSYSLSLKFGLNDITAYFFSAVLISFYAEIMARIRKYPAISYLVISAFPLIPGAGVYYTMNHAVKREMELFADRGLHTIAIAGMLAVGILLASTIVRIWSVWSQNHLRK